MAPGNKDAHHHRPYKRDLYSGVRRIWINPKDSPENVHIYHHLDSLDLSKVWTALSPPVSNTKQQIFRRHVARFRWPKSCARKLFGVWCRHQNVVSTRWALFPRQCFWRRGPLPLNGGLSSSGTPRGHFLLLAPISGLFEART
jgi:hypothetical protein